MSQSHAHILWREPAGSGAVPATTLMRWVETSAGSGVFDLTTVGAAGAALVKDVAHSSADVTMLDLTPGVSIGDATIVLTRDLANVY